MHARRILVVDDEEHIREIAAVSLELTAGWETRQAASGTECVAMATSWRPDAVLLDVMMPDMDGPAAFARLQADDRTSNIPVVLMTAKVQTSDRHRYTCLGVKGVIAKPFDPIDLAKRISEILDWA
ncbi:MAG: response regulator [Acidobacteriota bacterium]|nr:response regulator [Acidobacteriota bacterium]